MPTDPLTPPGPAHERPDAPGLWLKLGTFAAPRAYMIELEKGTLWANGEVVTHLPKGDYRGPYDPSLLWQQPQLPAGTVALLLEAAAELDAAADAYDMLDWQGAAATCKGLARDLRAEAGKGEGA